MQDERTWVKTWGKLKDKYFVVYVSHPALKYEGDSPYSNRQRKQHFAKDLEGKSLCNMDVQGGLKRYDFEPITNWGRKPQHGAGETCKVCWNEAHKGK